MTSYRSSEDLRRQDRALSGADRAEQARRDVEKHNRASLEADAITAALGSNSGGTIAPPPRETIDRILGRTNAPALATASVDYAAVAAKNKQVPASAWVRRRADSAGVELAAITPTGAGGRISERDVIAAERQQSQAHAAARAVAAATTANLLERRSLFMWSQMVRVNEYGANPLVEDIVQTNPAKAAFALASGDKPPTLFESGDLPVFTASGVAPSALAAVPWPVRHVVARLGNIDAAHLLNRFTPGPASNPASLAEEALMIFETDDENQAYKYRVEMWFDAWQPDYSSADANGFTTKWKKNDTRTWRP